MAKNPAKNLTVKDRILDEAEKLFAKKSYDAVSVREITKAAKCNLAAVNYHFGNKQNLYLEVFQSRWIPRAKQMWEGFKNEMASTKDHTAGSIIYSLAQAFLEGIASEEERRRHHQLLALEMAQPSKAFDTVVENVMLPFIREVTEYLKPFMPETIGEEKIVLNILAITSMVMYFTFSRSAVIRMARQEYTPEFRELLKKHISEFSLWGMSLSEKANPQ